MESHVHTLNSTWQILIRMIGKHGEIGLAVPGVYIKQEIELIFPDT